jgi:hypothetical protein
MLVEEELRLGGSPWLIRNPAIRGIDDRPARRGMMTGFALMVASGVVLLFGDPARFYLNIFFRVKVALLVLAGLNAFFFHASASGHDLRSWDLSLKTPFQARLAGSVSLVLWAGIITAGRMIAYNWFK